MRLKIENFEILGERIVLSIYLFQNFNSGIAPIRSVNYKNRLIKFTIPQKMQTY